MALGCIYGNADIKIHHKLGKSLSVDQNDFAVDRRYIVISALGKIRSRNKNAFSSPFTLQSSCKFKACLPLGSNSLRSASDRSNFAAK